MDQPYTNGFILLDQFDETRQKGSEESTQAAIKWKLGSSLSVLDNVDLSQNHDIFPLIVLIIINKITECPETFTSLFFIPKY